jgi:S-adenosylmethionine hydrolase
VVDPGVGSDRAGLMLKADGRWYVGPDNGLFDRIVAQSKSVQCWRIDWRPEHLSASFHGRDLFAPVAARLASGQSQPEQLGAAIHYQTQGWPAQLERIIYIDTYGNAMSGIQADTLPTTACLQVNQHTLCYARTFAEVPLGQGFWYENSSGLVEIAVNQGQADVKLGLRVGSPIAIVWD